MPNFIVWGQKYLERHPGTPRTERVTQADELEKLRWTPERNKKAHEMLKQTNRNTEDDRKSSPAPMNRTEPEATPEDAAAIPSVDNRRFYQGRTGGQWDSTVTFAPYQGTADELAERKSIPVTCWTSGNLPGVVRVWSRAERPAHWWGRVQMHCPTCNAVMDLDGEGKTGHSATYVCRYCSNHNY